MWENVIGRHIRRCNRNLLVVNAGILMGLLLWAYASERYLYNCFAGPFSIDHDALLTIENPTVLRRYFISVDQLKPLATGIEYVETTKDSATQTVTRHDVKATYFAAPIGSKLLVIKSPDPTPTSHYDGTLVAVPDDVRSYFQKELLDPKNRRFDEVFLPYVIDATRFRSDAYWALLFGVPLGCLAGFNVYKALVRIRSVEASPIVRSLQRFQQPPPNIAAMIDQELSTTKDLSCLTSVHLTPSWLMRESFFNLDVLHLNELIWVYQKVTNHYYYFVIPTGKTYAVVIGDVYGRRIEVDIGRGHKAKDLALSFTQRLLNPVPWVIAGYSDDLKREFEKHREGFVAAVQARRKQYFDTAKA